MTTPPAPHASPSRQIGWRRIAVPSTWAAVILAAVTALATTAASVIAGRLAEHTSARLVTLLAVTVLGGALVDTAGRFLWAGMVDRAAGQLRRDLVDAVLAQPLEALSEQAGGEILDRVDDDTHEISNLLRQQIWMVLRMTLAMVPMWIVAGITWWPAWVLFPLFAALTWVLMRSLLAPIAAGKVLEEAAWTEHAAIFEEGVAGRDDIRTSLGQPFVVARLAKLSARVHERFLAVVRLEVKLLLRTGLSLHLLLVLVVLAGVALASRTSMSVGDLVTMFLVTSTFVGMLARVAEQFPDMQAGLGAIVRLRALLAVPAEPEGGRALPEGPLDLDVRHLDFSYGTGTFALQDVDLHVPAGSTLALVGRTGSGKSTLASLVSRAVEPPPGSLFLGGVDVRDLDLEALRGGVGVVTQRTEILAGTLAENITVFEPLPRAQIEDVVETLGLGPWVSTLPDGLDTVLGPGGVSLSAGEEQLLAFARLLARDVRVIVLDEATARMDPVTEARVVAASARLLEGRTGILIAHRLGTIERADFIGVMERGRLVQFGRRDELLETPGYFRDLTEAAGASAVPAPDHEAPHVAHARRTGAAPVTRDIPEGSSLARAIINALKVRPEWGVVAIFAFLAFSIFGAIGSVTGWAWGHTVQALADGTSAWGWAAAVSVCVMLGPVSLAVAVIRYPRWWIEISLRVRMRVLIGQTGQHRLPRTPPGEVVARAMDSDRFVRYADRWIDFTNGFVIVVLTAVLGGTWLAGLVLLVIMVGSALASALGRRVAGRSAARASASRAQFGRALVSSLEAARTIKLAGRTGRIREHLAAVDRTRVEAAVREHRVAAVLDGVPTLMVQAGIVAAWAGALYGTWGLATALLVVNAASNFDWFGRVAGSVVTEAPGTRAWLRATSELAGGADLVDLPAGLDLPSGAAPQVPETPREPLRELALRDLAALHDDGTVGVEGVDLAVGQGELVLLLGTVGSGKSSLLAALAGLVHHTGSLTWNGREVSEPELFLRPGQVAYVAQTPRVLSGSFAENVLLGHEREFDTSVDAARLTPDIDNAGGRDSLVGHRGVRLSGGQVQRLALARALSTEAELLLADDVSSALDARTELELWDALRARGSAVVGATSKRSALARADRVVVLEAGRVADAGPWRELETRWSHLAG